ncbi:tetratricopeptide repeat protein [Ancylomarina sp. DW003]|nr:tetratricopeptide repeat protein [Ancylomarina sp. DW003]MDE5423327.1 tetratricopeptide repeat protein [Ancylomarina sp. DW003]
MKNRKSKCGDDVSITSLLNSADSVYYSDDFDSAVKLYSNILKKDSMVASAYFNRAYSESRLYCYNNSIKDYHASIKHKYRVIDALINIGCNYSALLNFDKALIYFDKALIIDSKNEKALYLKRICENELENLKR